MYQDFLIFERGALLLRYRRKISKDVSLCQVANEFQEKGSAELASAAAKKQLDVESKGAVNWGAQGDMEFQYM